MKYIHQYRAEKISLISLKERREERKRRENGMGKRKAGREKRKGEEMYVGIQENLT